MTKKRRKIIFLSKKKVKKKKKSVPRMVTDQGLSDLNMPERLNESSEEEKQKNLESEFNKVHMIS